MVCIELMIRLQRHTKVFRCIMAYGVKFLKHILMYLYCIKYNKVNICHSGTQKHVSYKKWDK